MIFSYLFKAFLIINESKEVIMFHNMYGYGWGMGWGWVISLIILVIIVWLVVKAINQNRTPHHPENNTPLDILKERYARGEIDKQEFQERKKDLS